LADETLIPGLVTKKQSGFFTVYTESYGPVICETRGRLLEERLDTDPVSLGDRVKIVLRPVLENDTVTYHGIIAEVEPREHAFTRQAPSAEGRRADKLPDREQVIIANPDQVVLVFACANPEPRLKMLDRFLVIAEKSSIPAIICANKLDLVKKKEAKDLFDLYDAIGYPVIYTSAMKGDGIKELKKALIGKISALSGPSGVGKSSLLNAVQPGLGLRVKEVSEATTKGKHTTVARELYPLQGGGFVADTPGIRAVALYNIEPSEIDGYFPDIEPYLHDCRFKDCRHENEPGCAVLAAVKEGDIWYERYDSYLRLREEAEEVYYRC